LAGGLTVAVDWSRPLVLPTDVELVHVSELAAELRLALPAEDGAWALTRRGVRAPSRLLDDRAHALLAEFRRPSRLVEAVVRFARARGEDPEALLAEAHAFLAPLAARGFLVAEGTAEDERPSFLPGSRLAGGTVVSCLQSAEDVELYQLRLDGPEGSVRPVGALKIARRGAPAERLEHEVLILSKLSAARFVPRLLARGEVEGRRFLLLSWVAGIDAARAAAELRRAHDRPGLLALARALAETYAGLHAGGVVHGDVHPGNVLIGADGEVSLLDFGHAGGGDLPAPAERGGVAFYYEPECAAALLARQAAPPPTSAGEQYALAALLFFLCTGRHRADFPLVREAMLAELSRVRPLPFSERGVAPWPGLEAVLGRALDPDPSARYPAVADLAAALAAEAAVPPASTRPVAGSRSRTLLAGFLERTGLDAELFRQGLPPPTASVAYGAAGVAAALCRVAVARQDPWLLATADAWAERAALGAEGDGAFTASGLEVSGETHGGASLFHGRAGIALVRAQIAHARADGATLGRRVVDFLASARDPGRGLDLVHGRSGLLTAIAQLSPLPRLGALQRGELVERGRDLLIEMLEELATRPPLGALAELPDLGLAHGWAGFLYGPLRFVRAAGEPVPDAVRERLDQLAAQAISQGRGLAWPWSEGRGDRRFGPPTLAGWCGGGAGFVDLWSEAFRTLGEEHFAALARGAAWNAWEGGPESGTLCCGLAGRAYALLHFHRQSGEVGWLDRARDLADRAAAAILQTAETRDSLLKGEAGVAALAADVERPEEAAMPGIGDEGWL
jgi:predicted Ser/Thr protein kinase